MQVKETKTIGLFFCFFFKQDEREQEQPQQNNHNNTDRGEEGREEERRGRGERNGVNQNRQKVTDCEREVQKLLRSGEIIIQEIEHLCIRWN